MTFAELCDDDSGLKHAQCACMMLYAPFLLLLLARLILNGILVVATLIKFGVKYVRCYIVSSTGEGLGTSARQCQQQ